MVNTRGRSFTRLAALLAGILGGIALANGVVFGQGFSAAISGVVRDTTGAVLPGVGITVKHVESGLTRTTASNENGGYSMPSLPVGPYELTADLPGFKQQIRRGITLVIGQEAVINLTMEVGAVAEQVTVTAEVPLVNTTLSSTSGLINETQIKDMPLNGRSFEQLLTLNTGTTNNNIHSTGSSFSVGGKRTESNRFTINGVDYVGDNATGQYIAPQGASQQLLGVDAVREYNVLGYTYGAEYGKRAGGQITVVTTSGTNRWRGSVFEYLRNSAFQAEPVWRIAGRPDHQRQDVLVRELRGIPGAPGKNQHCRCAQLAGTARPAAERFGAVCGSCQSPAGHAAVLPVLAGAEWRRDTGSEHRLAYRTCVSQQ